MSISIAILAVSVLVGAVEAEVKPPAGEPNPRIMVKGHSAAAYSLAFSSDAKMLATGGADKTVKLWDVASGKVTATFAEHAGAVWGLAFSPDGKILVAGSGRLDAQRQRYTSGELRIWDVARQSLVESFEGHADLVNAVAFSPDGALLA